LLRSKRDKGDIANLMFIAGWLAIIVGIAWGQVFPINKNLWTSSYVVFTSGAALSLLAVCYWTIEIKGWTRWAQPAVVYGRNAIVVFVMSGLLARILLITKWQGANGDTVSLYAWIYQNLFATWAGAINGSLAFALSTVLFWFWLMLALYRKEIFVKV
jgi:predicted acyltransferase